MYGCCNGRLCVVCVWLLLKSSSVHSVRMIVVQCVFVYLGCVSLMCIYVKHLEVVLDEALCQVFVVVIIIIIKIVKRLELF